MRITTVAVLIGLGFAATGCSGDDTAPFWRCSAVDATGATYVAEDVQGTAALEKAMYQCSLNAADPTRCTPGQCKSTW